MKLVVFAYHAIGSIALKTLLEQGAEVQALFTHEDDPHEEIWFQRPREIAEKNRIPVFTPTDVNQPEWIEKIRALKPDFLFSFYYRKIICEEILQIPKLGALNLHGSLLPKYRGKAPINWAVFNGEKETGISLHYMTRRADAGDIVGQRKVPIEFADTAVVVARKLESATADLLKEFYPKLTQGKAPRIPQDDSKATKFRGRTAEDGRIDWNQSALSIYNLIRAVTHPYPGAFTTLRGKKWFLWWAKPVDWDSSLAPGTIHHDQKQLWIDTAKARLLVERCQLEGENEMSGAEFIKNAKLKDGEVCGRKD